LAHELVQLTPTQLDGHLTDEPGGTDLAFQMVAAFVDQFREFLRRRQGQTGGAEDDKVEEPLCR
jgi:hypothetical protein